MTLDAEHLLRARFSALPRAIDDSDWADVRRRAGARRSRRVLAPLLGLALLAALVGTPAFGLSGKVVHLFADSQPAPSKVVQEFATLDVGAPPGMAPGVIAGETRMVLDENIGDGRRAVMWVAPTQSGGFCMTTAVGRMGGPPPGGGGGGCDRDRLGRFAPGLSAPGPISPEGKILRGPVLYYGSALVREAATVSIRFEDGDRAQVPLVWVSKPIDAGFFVYSVPEAHWASGHRPSTAVLEDRDGKELARERLPWIFVPPTASRRPAPGGARDSRAPRS